MSIYAPDIVSFDAIARLQFKGVDEYRKHWEACLSFCQGPITFEIHDLKITAGDDVAFSHCRGRCGERETARKTAGCEQLSVGAR
jgi:ketosteroid isomerase-like protein